MFEVLDKVCEPKRGTKYSAYVDLFAREDIAIGAGETKIVKLGVKLDIENNIDKIPMINWAKNKIQTDETREIYIKSELDKFLKSHYLEVALRSSPGVKGLIIANGIGIIDLDYPDEIGLIVHNPQNIKLFKRALSEEMRIENYKEPFEIKKGDKVAQCTLKEHKGYLMGYESDVVREGGFGSTGK